MSPHPLPQIFTMRHASSPPNQQRNSLYLTIREMSTPKVGATQHSLQKMGGMSPCLPTYLRNAKQPSVICGLWIFRICGSYSEVKQGYKVKSQIKDQSIVGINISILTHCAIGRFANPRSAFYPRPFNDISFNKGNKCSLPTPTDSLPSDSESMYRVAQKSKPLPNDLKIVLNRIKACQ